MISINFDNAYYLLIAIPLFAFVLTGFFIAFRKENSDKHAIASLVLHLIIATCITLAAAGINTTATLTQTHVYVVADVSYSAQRNLDAVDAHIQKLEKELPRNSKLGIVCFGRDYTLLSNLGDGLKSVKTAQVDDSATDIFKALSYTATLFRSDTIKRIVLITDGYQTGGVEDTTLYNAVETFKQQNIYVDAIFMDSTLPDTIKEVQLKNVEYVESTYAGRGQEAYVFIQSNYATQALVELYKGETLLQTQAVSLISGENDFVFTLDTATAGTFDYKAVVTADGDSANSNNDYAFTQTVASSKKVLLITTLQTDKTMLQASYGDGVELDARIVQNSKPTSLNVPSSLEELCQYDEIVLSQIDVRMLNNYRQFVTNLNMAVSTYGKSLITFGDLQLQAKTDDAETLTQLENMLPVKFGTSEQDPTLYGLLIDASHSMNQAGRWAWTIRAAEYLIEQMRETDGFTICYFAASGELLHATSEATVLNKRQALEKLYNLQTGQGTYIGSGLHQMQMEMKSAPQKYTKKQVILISDGNDYKSEAQYSATGIAAELRLEGVRVSALNIGVNEGDARYLQSITNAGGGTYYSAFSDAELKQVLENSITDNLLGLVVQSDTRVKVQTPLDSVLNGITSFNNISGYICGRVIPGAIVVLNVDYINADGSIVEVPLYAHKDCGNGKVATFTSTLSGRWVQSFMNDTGKQFLGNVIETSTPDLRSDYPFTVNITTGDSTEIEVVPSTLSRETQVLVTCTAPNGEVIQQTLSFDGKRHFVNITSTQLGKYTVEIVYTNNGVSYTTTKQFHIPYQEEYNAFAGYDAGLLYSIIGDRGTVVSEGTLKLKNNPSDIATYTMHFTLPLMIISVILYVADIAIRKLKWNDIKGLFVKVKKGGKDEKNS